MVKMKLNHGDMSTSHCPICNVEFVGNKRAGVRFYCNCKTGYWERSIDYNNPWTWIAKDWPDKIKQTKVEMDQLIMNIGGAN